jgi:hypothetical protein
MTTITAPLTSLTLAAPVPDIVRSCVVSQPSPPPAPGEEPPAPVTGPGIYTPIAPGVTYANLPVAPTVIDTSPNQMIGCIVTVADNPQGRLDALFPSAVDGDGVIDRATNDIWVYNGTTWDNVGPTPGPTIVATVVIPPWNEIVRVAARTRTKLTVTSLPYALTLLTEPDPIITRTALTVTSIRKISVPATAIAAAAATPQVSISATVFAPASAIALAPAAPSVVIEIPPGVPVPATAIELAAPVPQVSTGVSVAVPVTDTVFVAPVPSVATGVADPDFSSVSLLLHMDGSNGSTTFTDFSSNAFAITAFGNAQVSTADPKYGTGCLTLDGSGDYLQTPSNSAFAFGTGNFTIEMWLKPTTVSGNDGVFTTGSGVSLASFQGFWFLSNTGAGGTNMGSATAGSWQHVAITRSGTSVRMFINGTQLGSTLTWSTNFTQTQFFIGYYSSSSFGFEGLIDEFRVTKGVARYTANFTAPTAPFPDL